MNNSEAGEVEKWRGRAPPVEEAERECGQLACLPSGKAKCQLQ